MRLGRLHKVQLRTVWPSESASFTPWLAQPENLKLLGDAIGIELELESTEKDVGPFSADILCKDTSTGDWVVIENQLEKTDHTHLGQLLTYAAGLKATTVVWVAGKFTDQHRAVLDWLNDVTDDRVNFFALEVELWQIEDSPIAPRFNVVSKPNEWSRDIVAGASGRGGELTDAKKLQLEFWTAFREYVLEKGASIKPTKPLPQNWMTIGIGRSDFWLDAIASMYDSETGSYDRQEIRAQLVIGGNNSKTYFAALKQRAKEIEAEFGEPLIWHNPDDARTCRIYVRKAVSLFDKGDWPDHHAWLLKNLEKLKAVFGPRIHEL